jgi:diaminohydroxyphosphoribosylaminopyrimidine deaminase/5-amino-6-(5-phosphoribosylamino)uracil reductase
MTPHEHFMQRALELALLGAGHVSPNPRVGCVIVYDGKIIGEGWHQKYGQAHAEVNAIQSVKDKELLPMSTMYVTLEPCSHFGKTPPCADLIIEKKIRKVYIANVDSNPLVAGRGIEKLRQAGIEVETGLLEKQARHLNKRFFTFIEKQRPYIILKWAQTADGFIAQSNYESKWISHELSRQLVHKMRSEEDAVLVGARTASHDNPKLNVREWSGRNPVRIVMDRFLRLPHSLHLFDRSQPTVVYNVLKHEEHEHLIFVRISEENFINEMLADMYHRKIQSVIVEGGAQTLGLFIQQRLWDEAYVFTSNRTFEKGIAAPTINGRLDVSSRLGDDKLNVYFPI